MATYKGNRDALEDVHLGMRRRYEQRLVQEFVDATGRSPFFSVQYLAGVTSDWQLLDCEGYEVLVLAGDTQQVLNGDIAYLRFGSGGPSSAASTSVEGAIPAIPGTRIPVPQGFHKMWFKPTLTSSWRIVVSRLPFVHVEYGPYGANMARGEPVYQTWSDFLLSNGGALGLVVKTADLIAGDYEVKVWASDDDGKDYIVAQVAHSETYLWQTRGYGNFGTNYHWERVTVAARDRFQVTTGSAPTLNQGYAATISLRRWGAADAVPNYAYPT